MPIGFDQGDRGGSVAPVASRPNAGLAQRASAASSAMLAVAPSVPTLTPTEFAATVRATVEANPLLPTIHERWRTAADERVCPECGPLDGATWPVGIGPLPPIHVNCRCTREYAFTTWSSR